MIRWETKEKEIYLDILEMKKCLEKFQSEFGHWMNIGMFRNPDGSIGSFFIGSLKEYLDNLE